MAGAEAEEYLSQLGRLNRPVPEDIKELKLRYNVKVRLLGTVELKRENFRYIPGIRTLPHLGADVCRPTEDALKYICNARLEEEQDAVPIGHYALGDQVFPELEVKFSFSRLLARRTLVFARTGYGKSNLIKLLVAKLYEQEQQVGMLIFDPEGEYSFRDVQGRPGLADLPGICEKLVVFTDRRPPDEKYESLIAGPVRVNLRRVTASHVVDICLPEERQDTVYATHLRGFEQQEWAECIDLLARDGYRLDPEVIRKRFYFRRDPDAVIRNITPVVQRLHDPNSHLPQSMLYHLAKGRIVVVDISLLSSGDGLQIAGLILKTIFDHNVAHFTSDERDAVIPVVAVIEEAQNVLSTEKMKKENSPFVEWVKEGRKYNLGAIIVTQQPGAISDQLLSQGDNFFALHLVSNADLSALQRNNAHFSNDILSYILNEPIEGNAYFWSAPSQPYVISARLLSFEEYVKDKLKEVEQPTSAALGADVRDYQALVDELHSLVDEVIASDRRVPVYTPIRNGAVVEGYGAVGQANLGLRVAECFLERHPDVKPWMLPQFFEEWQDKPILRWDYTAALGERIKGSKDNRSANYLLIPLSEISFRDNKALDPRRVVLLVSTEQPESEETPGSSQQPEQATLF
jgi:hypothetical protein